MNRSVIGDSPRRREDARFITGRGAYIDDLKFDGLSRAVFVRSPHAHARIRSIDASAARQAPGVLAVLTAAEAKADGLKQLRPYAEANVQTGERFIFDEQPLLAGEKVRFMGETVAMVIAETLAQALDAAELVEVDYEPLPAVTSARAAVAPNAPLLSPEVPGNVCMDWRTGDAKGAEAAFDTAAHVITLALDNHRVTTNPIEPRGSVGTFEPASGRYTLHISSQSTFFDRFGLMGIFGIPANKIRIISPYLGGGFGSKSEPHSIYVVAIQASMNLGRPVKMFHSRDEEFTSSRTRHREILYLKTGLKRDGTITARQARVILNNGAYTSYGPGVSVTQSMLGGAVYKIPHYRYDGYTVYTNTPISGAFRGFGSPQFTFAAEIHTDLIAERLGMDPVEFRLKNLSEPGDVAVSGPRLTTCGIRDCLTAAAKAIGWDSRRGHGQGNRGIGLACGTHFTSGKFHPGLNADFCASSVKVNPDGSVTLMIGATEMGTGAATTAVSQICAEELGVGIGDVQVITSDSETIPADFGTYGSRVTTLAGNAVRLACQHVREQLLHYGAEALGTGADELTLGGGRIFVRDDPGRGLTLGEVALSALFRDREGQQIMAMAHYDAPCDMPDPETGIGDFAQSYSFGVHAVEVLVDEETGHVKVLNFVAATDCGNLINPALAESQVEGGVAQGLGYALMEDLVCDEDGQVLNPHLSGYRVPTATEMPPITALWVQTNDPRGPYGAKGLGEMGLVPTAAAVSNAICDATGARLTKIPMTPERVLDAMRVVRQGGE